MKTLGHHISVVRSKPAHVRKQVAFALAAGATALIALIWLVASLSAGSFHIADSSFADAESAPAAGTASSASNTSLLGAALSAFSAAPAPAQLEVVGASASATAPSAASAEDTRTFIPF
ncbi:MAG: hypothetical protein ACREGR_02915 [Minisyncoccia bacterium]